MLRIFDRMILVQNNQYYFDSIIIHGVSWKNEERERDCNKTHHTPNAQMLYDPDPAPRTYWDSIRLTYAYSQHT